jgi:AbrB family looped-hinge helix DNA binding protein
MKHGLDFDDAFYGSATVGERGQIVIPADARHELGLKPGDKVLIMRHPIHKGLMVFQLESVKEFLDEFSAGVQRIEAQAQAKAQVQNELKTGEKG